MNSFTQITKTLTSLSLAAIAFTGCSGIAIRGTGPAYEATHDLSETSEITIRGTGQLRIQNGAVDQLIILAQEEIHENLIVRQEGGRVIIEPESGYYFRTSKPIEYLLITNDLSKVALSGAVDLVSDAYQTDQLMVKTSGTSDIDLSLECDVITISAAGSFDGYLTGSADSLNLDFSGAADINAYDLTAAQVSVDLSGAGTIYVTATETLDISAAGAGTVAYKGNPSINQSAAGAIRITNTE